MLPLAAIAVGALLGFVGSRKLRRPPHVAQAAAVARSVGGTSSGSRRKTLTAPELQRACFSEMVRHVRVNRQGRTEAPGRYLIQLSPIDLEVVEETRSWFTDGLAEALTTAAKDNGWEIAGTIDIRFAADPSRRPGAPNALAVDPDGPKKAQPTAPPPAAPTSGTTRGASPTALVLVRSDTGERTPLGAGPITIGRSSSSGIRVDDTRVSRTHAIVSPAGSGWTISDDGSSNGTRLNGRSLAAKTATPLSAGDRIGIGPVELVVEAAGGGRPAGSRALDDSDRTRISGEVLPPPRRPRS